MKFQIATKKLSKSDNRKTNNLFTLLIGLLALIMVQEKLYAQAIPPSTGYNPVQFNTGICAQTTTPQLTWWGIPFGQNDPNWKVDGSSGGPGTTAAVVGTTPTACGWNNALPGFPYSRWITAPFNNCGNPSSSYSCAAGTPIWFFKRSFFLPANSVFMVNWRIFASGWVEAIRVNGITTYTASYTLPNTPNNANNPVSFSWCWNWNYGGLNTVEIEVRNNGSTPNACKNTALLVESWSLPANPYPTMTSPTLACASYSNLLTIPTGPGTYSWTLPTTWGGSSSNYTLSAITGSLSGIVYGAKVAAGSPKKCLSISGFSITVPPPLTITPSATNICKGTPVTLSGSGANTYTWFAPNPVLPGPIGNSAVISVTPMVNTLYTLKGHTPLGNCLYTKSVNIVVKPVPFLTINSSTPQVCQGNSAVLQASGNSQMPYVWYTIPSTTLSSGPFLTVTPNITNTYVAMAQFSNGCTSTLAISIPVLPQPNITANASPNIVCAGDQVILSATGGTNYVWLPIGFSGSPLSIYPINSTNYTVIATGVNGCTNSAIASVSVLITPTLTITPPQICPGITNTLIVSGSSNNTYTWKIGNPPNQTVITGTNTIILTPTVATPYTVCATAGNSCVACVSGTLTFGTPIPLTAPNVTLCTNAGSCTTVSVSSTPGSNVNYTWQPTGQTGSLVTVCPTVKTVYTVSASSPSVGCPNSSTMAVIIATNCCAQPTIGLTSLNPANGIGGSYSNTSYILDASTTLTSSAYFANSEVWITPGVSITVPSGMQLDLETTHLFACGQNMWQGIIIQDGGRITTLNTRLGNSMIEDAVVAIQLDNISLTNSSPNPPRDIQRIIFNRNLIGIQISNSDPGITHLPLGITGCIFSSRNMPYTTFSATPTWPNADMSILPGALRWPAANTPTTGLASPYSFFGWLPSTLKAPYTNQPGHIGIKIFNIGNPNGILPTPGVEIGVTYPGAITNDFNLFDNIGVGIEILNSSLTTKNNVFQNLVSFSTTLSPSGTFGGIGIKHDITTLMNARLDLTNSNSASEGNRFWNCHTGILVNNVYDCWVRYGVFRSTHSVNTALNNTPQSGDAGVDITTNRFDFTVTESQFNNLRNGIIFNTPSVTMNYVVSASSTLSGVCVRGINIERNYFGALVTSTAPYSLGNANTSEYMSDAIQLNTPNTAGWAYQPNTNILSYIISNKINRAFRGISINGMENAPLAIAENTVLIEDDFTFGPGPGLPAFGYGISVVNNKDNLSITNNTLEAQPWHIPTTTPTISLIYCRNNDATVFNSPRIECNSVKNSYYGFQFDGANRNTVWEGNEMCTHWSGMALTHDGTNGGEIGTQGSSSAASGNIWSTNTMACGIWGFGFAPYQTYCEDSDPVNSFLWVKNGSLADVPIHNHNSLFNPFTPQNYQLSISIDDLPMTNRLNGCVGNTSYLPPPNWRGSQPNSELTLDGSNKFEKNLILIYPNPTNSMLWVTPLVKETLFQVEIFDINGKLVQAELEFKTSHLLDLSSLPSSIYTLLIRESNQTTSYKKLIKSN